MSQKQVKLLLVDDSRSDCVIIERCLAQSQLKCDLQTAHHGEEALNALNTSFEKQNNSMQLPDLILMDINMPVMDGKAALTKIREDKRFRHIPVLMLSTSSREEDISECYDRGANAYLTKPIEHARMVDMMNQIHDFWLKTAYIVRH